MKCPCGNLDYSQCCEPYLQGKKFAPTPEALMRSRYSAYVKGAIPYLRETLAPESRFDFKEGETLEWSKQAEWLGLEMLNAEGNQVEFIARYRIQGKLLEHHEVSTFSQIHGRWYFVDGETKTQGENAESQAPRLPVKRESAKIGRNDPCTCGSGKKYKKCCGAKPS